MKKKLISLLCAAALMAGLFAGCAGKFAVDGVIPSQVQPETELVPVLDEQYTDILNDYHIVGQFHSGVAFAARLLYPSEHEIDSETYTPAVECGYVTLDGAYTSLYTVPNEYALLSPEGLFPKGRVVTGDLFNMTYEAFAIMSEDSAMAEECRTMPLCDEQELIDEVFAVGENGWVPYYDGGKWGYSDLQGGVKIAPAYDFVLPFSAGVALVCTYDGVYHWKTIDETGAVQMEFEPQTCFAVREPGTESCIFIDPFGCFGPLYRLDGTRVGQKEDITEYVEKDEFVLADSLNTPCVYDREGNVLYESDDLVLTGLQNGCTAYSDGEYFGIRGSDGAARCEAKFIEIYALEPEGVYAREQSSQSVGLYDYDGNLIRQAVPCVRIADRTGGGYTVYDGAGNTLAEYPAQVDAACMTGERFFTREGFAYLRLSDEEFVTLHIAWEERPAAQQEQPSQSTASGDEQISGASQTKTGLAVSASQPLRMLDLGGMPIAEWIFDFSLWDYDSRSLSERFVLSTYAMCTESLECYRTMENEIVVCDETFRTIFTVPHEAIEFTEGALCDATKQPTLFYLGQDVWALLLNGTRYVKGDINEEYYAVYVIDRQGNVLAQSMASSKDENFHGIEVAIVSDGYFYFEPENRFYALSGKNVDVPAAADDAYANCPVFSEGMANTCAGYINAQGNVVLSAGQLRQNTAEYLNVPADAVSLTFGPFENGKAVVQADVFNAETLQSNQINLCIDTTGSIQGETDEFLWGIGDAREELREELQEQHELKKGHGFTVTLRTDQPSTLTTPTGAEILEPKNMEFDGSVVQGGDYFAFVKDKNTGYILVDANGKLYPECTWQNVYITGSGAAMGVIRVESAGEERSVYEYTRLSITVQ